MVKTFTQTHDSGCPTRYYSKKQKIKKNKAKQNKKTVIPKDLNATYQLNSL